MKNILLLTPVYPGPDAHKSTTPVVHYFAREWVKMGYNVMVMHLPANFPNIVYWFLKPFSEKVGSKAGSEIRTWPLHEQEYEIDDVKIQRFPLSKMKPHARFPKNQIEKTVINIIDYCERKGFKPEVIISHWANPCFEIMHNLKSYYNIPTCYIAHDGGTDLKGIFKKEAKQYIEETDLFGYRSGYIQKCFEEYFGNSSKPNFLCSSGIPQYYLENVNKTYSEIHKFIFVGTLFRRKYPAEIIPAVCNSFDGKDFEIRYIGDGEEIKTTKDVAARYEVEDKVHFLGRIPREEVLRNLDESDVFVMISRGETFGLVYLEAMARGLITIAARKEGFDGIIKDGENGFLCEAGNVNELASIIKRLRNMTSDELNMISYNARKTAENLTDVKAAATYMSNIEKYCFNENL